MNVYIPCDYHNVDSLIEYKSTLSDISNVCSFETYDEIIIVGDFNCDPNKGRFFEEFMIFITTHSFIIPDISC